MARPPLSLADQVCLAVVGEGPTHGWALVKLLAPDGELGRIWSLSRPLTYRAIDRLVETGLVTRADATPLASGRRSELRITPAGRRERRRWLDVPVEHLRDLRTEFLLKVALRTREARDSTDLFTRQLDVLQPAIAALADHRSDDPVDRWRRESALAAQRFLRESIR